MLNELWNVRLLNNAGKRSQNEEVRVRKIGSFERFMKRCRKERFVSFSNLKEEEFYGKVSVFLEVDSSDLKGIRKKGGLEENM